MMEYAIETLEIEVARLRQAAREQDAAPITNQDFLWEAKQRRNELLSRVDGLKDAINLLRGYDAQIEREILEFARRTAKRVSPAQVNREMPPTRSQVIHKATRYWPDIGPEEVMKNSGPVWG